MLLCYNVKNKYSLGLNMAVPIQVIRLSVLGVVIAGFVTFKYVAAAMIEDKIDMAMTKAGIPTESFSYDTSVDLLGFNTHLKNIELTLPNKESVKIDEITINSFDADHKIPEFMDIEIEGLESKKALKSLPFARASRDIFDNMEKVNVNFAIKYKFDSEDKILDIKEISESVDHLGELSFSTELHHIDSMQSLLQRMMLNPYSLSVGKSELAYKDDSLVEKIILMNAKQQGVSVSQYKEKVVQKLNKELDKIESKKSAALEKELLSAVIDFVEDSDEFSISIDPQKPMTLREMSTGNPSANLEKLNLEIN